MLAHGAQSQARSAAPSRCGRVAAISLCVAKQFFRRPGKNLAAGSAGRVGYSIVNVQRSKGSPLEYVPLKGCRAGRIFPGRSPGPTTTKSPPHGSTMANARMALACMPGAAQRRLGSLPRGTDMGDGRLRLPRPNAALRERARGSNEVQFPATQTGRSCGSERHAAVRGARASAGFRGVHAVVPVEFGGGRDGRARHVVPLQVAGASWSVEASSRTAVDTRRGTKRNEWPPPSARACGGHRMHGGHVVAPVEFGRGKDGRARHVVPLQFAGAALSVEASSRTAVDARRDTKRNEWPPPSATAGGEHRMHGGHVVVPVEFGGGRDDRARHVVPLQVAGASWSMEASSRMPHRAYGLLRDPQMGLRCAPAQFGEGRSRGCSLQRVSGKKRSCQNFGALVWMMGDDRLTPARAGAGNSFIGKVNLRGVTGSGERRKWLSSPRIVQNLTFRSQGRVCAGVTKTE